MGGYDVTAEEKEEVGRGKKGDLFAPRGGLNGDRNRTDECKREYRELVVIKTQEYADRDGLLHQKRGEEGNIIGNYY